MTESLTIPLNKLLAWEGNVRKTDPDKGIDELAASIAAHGLLQSLVVRKDRRGKYAVIAGRRRLLALKSLSDAGTIEGSRAIPCTVLDDDADATEVSLAENVQREPMHPADEFDAFKALIESGVPVADVAARFGVTETVVEKRLKLARVSPRLLAAYRNGEMTLKHVIAFTVTDDHAAQERLWKELPDWQRDNPEDIRGMLTEQEITAADRRVAFVTLKAYEKAGGTTRRDLFSEDDNGIFIEDVVLLESLVAKKLEKTAIRVRKEGWKWVEIRSSFDHDEWSKCQRYHPEHRSFSLAEEAESLRLEEEHDKLRELDEPDADQQARLNAITERIVELEEGTETWPPETLAMAGAVVTLGHDGGAAVHAGLVKPEDAPPKARRSKGEDEQKTPFSASLMESLTAHRSAAINAALMKHPLIALAATVHALCLGVFYNGSRDGTALQIRGSAASLQRVEGSVASAAIAAAGEQWAKHIPDDPADVFPWCLCLPQDRLMQLLAFCAAQTVNAVRVKTERDVEVRMRHAASLADALDLDMTEWFTPTADNYFAKISKAQIIDALREVKGSVAPAWDSMKKSELSALAERETAGKGWIPEPLRKAGQIVAPDA